MRMKSNQSRALLPVKDSRFRRIRGLNCYDDVYKRLCEGWAPSEVARYIQQERGECTDISSTGLTQQLSKFRASLPAAKLVQKRFPEIIAAAKQEIFEGIDELKELEDLYRLQMRRIHIDTENEKKINKLMPSMTGEIREARQILESVANIKMELGISQRAPTVDVSVGVEVGARMEADFSGNFGSDAVKNVLEDAEARRRVMGVVERFLKLPVPVRESNDH